MKKSFCDLCAEEIKGGPPINSTGQEFLLPVDHSNKSVFVTVRVLARTEIRPTLALGELCEKCALAAAATAIAAALAPPAPAEPPLAPKSA